LKNLFQERYSFKPENGGSLQKKEVYNTGENLSTMGENGKVVRPAT
jgi:hypothetical protein